MRNLKIPTNLTALAYKSIKEYILDGNLDNDFRLTEEFLSGQLGISKSPIREAAGPSGRWLRRAAVGFRGRLHHPCR